MIRFFSASSQAGTALIAHYAHSTQSKDNFDILIIDKVLKKKSLIKQVYGSSAIHPWNYILDLSTHIDDNYDFKIKSGKKLTRKFKNHFIIKPFYSILLRFYLRQEKKQVRKELKEKLASLITGFDIEKSAVEINTLPLLRINEALFSLFKEKEIHYFEHGIGDYSDIFKEKEKKNFYCVFATAYKSFLQRRNITHVHAIHYINAGEFEKLAKKIYTAEIPEEKAFLDLEDKKCAVILLDASEMYNPPAEYWTDYIQSCINCVPEPQQYTFVLKPHGLMSEYSQQLSYSYIRSSGLKHIIIDRHSSFFNMGIEIMFSKMKSKIAYVMSTFSTSIFFLPHFYPGEAVYIHHYYFCKKYFRRAPLQYKTLFESLEPLIEEVFNEKQAGLKGV